MSAPTPLTPENAIRTLKQLVCGASPWGATGPLMMCLIDCKASTLLELVEQIEIAFTAETKRADEALESVKYWMSAASNANASEAEAERQRDDLAARVVVLVDAVVDACASECKLRDEAKRIMSPDLERYAEAAHSLANLKARILAMTDGIAAAVALRERLEKAEQDARGERLVSHAFKVLLDSAQGRITALEATARTPGTVDVCERHALNDCEDYAGRHEKPKECPVFGCPIIRSSAAKKEAV